VKQYTASVDFDQRLADADIAGSLAHARMLAATGVLTAEDLASIERGLAAIKGEKTLADLAQQFDIHSNQITQWKAQLLEGAAGVFGAEARPEPAAPAVDLKSLHAKIGELTLEKDFLEGALSKAGLLSAK